MSSSPGTERGRKLAWIQSRGRGLAGTAIKRGRLFYQILRAAMEKFLADNCTVRANAIAYAIVVSIIPVFTVLIRFGNFDQADIRNNLAGFLAAYGLTETNELLSIIDQILKNADAIAGVGVIFIIYAATNLLVHLEDAFNFIYRARRARPLIYRFSLYIAAFAILPTLVIVTTRGASFFINQIRPPNLNHVLKVGDRYWITASNGILRNTTEERIRKDSKDFSETNLRTVVIQDTRFRDLYFDAESYVKRIGDAATIISKEYPGAPVDTEDFFSLYKAGYGDGTLFVISRTGVLFYSTDSGRTFDYHKLQFKSGNGSRNPRVEDMHVTDDGRVLILLTVGSRSGLVTRNGSGEDFEDWRYKPFDGIYRHMFSIQNIAPEARNIFRNGLYIAGKGRYLFSADGDRWIGSFEERLGGASVSITSMTADRDGNMHFGGANGAFWKNANGTRTSPSLRAEFDQAVRGVHIGENGEGFLYGANGLFRYTRDGGKNWLLTDTGALEDASFLSHTVMPDGSVLLAGEEASLMHIARPHLMEQRDENGYQYVDYETDVLARFHRLRALLLRFFLGIFLLLTIFALIAPAYALVPFATVDWKSASVGAAITTVALLVFIIIFRVWAGGSTTTGVIYGVWAAVPLGLLVILASTQIILFGLEVAYVIQHPYLYKGLGGHSEDGQNENDSLLWNFLLLISLTYHHLYDRKRPLTNEQALRFFGRNISKLEYARDKLVQTGVIGYDASAGEYFPVRPPSEIKVSQLERTIIESALKMPDHAFSGRFSTRVKKFQKGIQAQLDKATGDLSIADLLPLLKGASRREKE
ncbi:MAG: YhjD/YihY/BrkB family envelope integrity protein [Leptospirales bacterium]